MVKIKNLVLLKFLKWFKTCLLMVSSRFLFLSSLVLLVSCARLLPHFPNASPLVAVTLFGSVYFFNRWIGIAVSVFSAWFSDLLLNNIVYTQYFPVFTWFYKGFYFQYGSYLLIGIFSSFLLKTFNFNRLMLTSIFSSLLFFFISNFGVWMNGHLYPKTFAGLQLCYIAGLPFLKGTIFGDFGYSVILFYGFNLLEKRLFDKFRISKHVY